MRIGHFSLLIILGERATECVGNIGVESLYGRAHKGDGDDAEHAEKYNEKCIVHHIGAFCGAFFLEEVCQAFRVSCFLADFCSKIRKL